MLVEHEYSLPNSANIGILFLTDLGKLAAGLPCGAIASATVFVAAAAIDSCARDYLQLVLLCASIVSAVFFFAAADDS